MKLVEIFRLGLRKNQYLPLFIIVVLIFVFFVFNSTIHLNGKTTYWDRVVDPALAVSGFILPAVIWLYYIFNNDWKDGLTKRLTVHFVLKDNYVLTCFESNLSSEGDIRNWGQQIGSQMNGGGILSLLPYIKTQPAVEKYDEKRKEFYLLYELTMFLKFDENGKYVPAKNTITVFDEDKYTLWIDNNYDTPGNREVSIEKSPKPMELDNPMLIERLSN